jgi:hypothetical protein
MLIEYPRVTKGNNMTNYLKPVVRPIAPFENNSKQKNNIVDAHTIVIRISRKGVSAPRETKIKTPCTIVIKTITLTTNPINKKTPKVSKKKIDNARNRKQVLRETRPTVTADYDILKKRNLKQLVKEYEAERAASDTNKERKDILDALMLEAMIKSDDIAKEQVFADMQLRKEAEKYYQDIIDGYHIVDIARRAVAQADEIYRDLPKMHRLHKRDTVIPTPHQLRMVVNSFNNQYK